MATGDGCKSCLEMDHGKLQSIYGCLLSSRRCKAVAVGKQTDFGGLAKHAGVRDSVDVTHLDVQKVFDKVFHQVIEGMKLL